MSNILTAKEAERLALRFVPEQETRKKVQQWVREISKLVKREALCGKFRLNLNYFLTLTESDGVFEPDKSEALKFSLAQLGFNICSVKQDIYLTWDSKRMKKP